MSGIQPKITKPVEVEICYTHSQGEKNRLKQT